MTVVTGKGGRYKYYKCTQRQNRGNHACSSGNIPMEQLDSLLLAKLADGIFSPERLQALIVELRKVARSSKDQQQAIINDLNRQLKSLEDRYQRLLEAIEGGTLGLDEFTQRRAQQNKVAREALEVEIAKRQREGALPEVREIKPSQVGHLSSVLRQKLLAKGSPLAKRYLSILVDEVVVAEETVTIKGSHAALASTLQAIQKGEPGQVPSFIHEWRARRDSNSRPPSS